MPGTSPSPCVGNLDAMGNARTNLLTGNAGNAGNAGNDVLEGGADSLRGNGSADSFLFRDALGLSNIDILADFSVPADTIERENAIFTTIAWHGNTDGGPVRRQHHRPRHR